MWQGPPRVKSFTAILSTDYTDYAEFCAISVICGSKRLLTDPQRAHNMRALSKSIIGVVLVHT